MAEPLARAEFDYDLDDLVDVAWRSLLTSPTLRRHRNLATFVGAPVCGVAIAGLTHWLRPVQPWVSFASGLVYAVSIALLCRYRWPTHVQKMLRKRLREQYGDGTRRCTVELYDDHTLWREPNLDYRLAWRDVLSIEPDANDIVVTSRTGVSVVRGRAFADPAARAHFTATATRLLAANRGRA